MDFFWEIHWCWRWVHPSGTKHMGEVGGERQVWICVERTRMKQGSAGSCWRLHHSPRGLQGEGSSSSRFQRAFPRCRWPGDLCQCIYFLWSLLTVERHPKVRLHTSCWRWEMRWAFLVERNSLLVSCPLWAGPFLVTVGSSAPVGGLPGRHCLRLGWKLSVHWMQSGDDMLGTPNPCHFGVFLWHYWRCNSAA